VRDREIEDMRGLHVDHEIERRRSLVPTVLRRRLSVRRCMNNASTTSSPEFVPCSSEARTARYTRCSSVPWVARLKPSVVLRSAEPVAQRTGSAAIDFDHLDPGRPFCQPPDVWRAASTRGALGSGLPAVASQSPS